MRKITLSLFIVLVSVFTVGHGYALFQDLVIAQDNKFYSGQFNLQISSTDADGDNIAEANFNNWSDDVEGVWSTPLQWMPGDQLSSKIFLRNKGDVDAESVYLTMTGRKYYGENHLDEVINLISAWYDRNGDGIQDDDEDILPDLIAAYDTNGDDFTLLDFYHGMDLVHEGVAFDLEAGAAVLPGRYTNPDLGGRAGHGKGLFFTWQYDPEADVRYQGGIVDVDLEFTAVQESN